MNAALLVELMRLINNLGFEAAIAVMEGLGKATTIDEAIAALNQSRQKTWGQFKGEAANPPAP